MDNKIKKGNKDCTSCEYFMIDRDFYWGFCYCKKKEIVLLRKLGCNFKTCKEYKKK